MFPLSRWQAVFFLLSLLNRCSAVHLCRLLLKDGDSFHQSVCKRYGAWVPPLLYKTFIIVCFILLTLTLFHSLSFLFLFLLFPFVSQVIR